MTQRKRHSGRRKALKRVGINIARHLANLLIDVGYLVSEPFETHYQRHRRIEGFPKDVSAHRVRQEIKRMRDRGWIQEAEKNGKKFLKLTQQGRLGILYKNLKNTAQSAKNNWDGKWRLVMFDIPEQGRKERNAIRDVLKSIGFCQMQKSVYIFPHEIPQDAVSYLKESGLWSYIRFAQSDGMANDADMRKYFSVYHDGA
ncbi:MAG: CRISPR-associated endonuclease Cas2 [Patescibacteria group bacterium]